MKKCLYKLALLIVPSLSGCTIAEVPPGTELTDCVYIGTFKGHDIHRVSTEFETFYVAENAVTITKPVTKQSPRVTIILNGETYERREKK